MPLEMSTVPGLNSVWKYTPLLPSASHLNRSDSQKSLYGFSVRRYPYSFVTPCPWMVPSSTVHFSFPTGTQFARSRALKSFTHCSLGYGARLRGTCAVSRTGNTSARRRLVIRLSLAEILDFPSRAILAPNKARCLRRVRELH